MDEGADKMVIFINGKPVKLKYNSHGQLQADDGGPEAAPVTFIQVKPCKTLEEEREDQKRHDRRVTELLMQQEYEKSLEKKAFDASENQRVLKTVERVCEGKNGKIWLHITLGTFYG